MEKNRSKKLYLFTRIGAAALLMITLIFSNFIPYSIASFIINVILANIIFSIFATILYNKKTYFIAILASAFVLPLYVAKFAFDGIFVYFNLIYFSVGIFIAIILAAFVQSRFFTLPKPLKNKVLVHLTTYCLVFAAVFSLLYTAFNTNINTVYYSIKIPNLPAELSGLKIVQISDTHSTAYIEGEKGLIENVKIENPDLIFMTGDISDDDEPFEATETLLDGIKDVAPIYYTVGNHEFWSPQFWERDEKIESYGLNMLENENVVFEYNGATIQISGVDDPEGSEVRPDGKSINQNLEEMNASEPDCDIEILLSHRPELVHLYEQYDYDLIFTGHAHGGQVRVPFLLNGLYSPNQGFFPDYSGGVYNIPSQNPNGTQMVVSRGLSISSVPRVFNPPELVVVTLI